VPERDSSDPDSERKPKPDNEPNPPISLQVSSRRYT
jgi:hypothetical protein